MAVSNYSPSGRYQALVTTIKKYDANFDFARLKEAYAFASAAHQAQVRESGEPYIMHPLAVAQTLAELKLDADSIVAGMLHDVVEDTNTPLAQLETLFGVDVMRLVDGVTKLAKAPFATREERQAENTRRMFVAMSKDLRVVLIKLSDRLHNMRCMKIMPPEHQRAKATETLRIFAPLANRLGMFKLQSELEDLSLMFLEPNDYYRLTADLAEKWYARDAVFSEITQVLRDKLAGVGIEAHIDHRMKHLYSIYKKMQRQRKQMSEIYDIFAVRVIVNTKADCYAALGYIHEIYIPVADRIKDYIATPKNNQYQSLHTTLVAGGSRTAEGAKFEVQIRTWDMHRTAEYGIAAHWRYKETGGSEIRLKDRDDNKIAWLRRLIDWQSDNRDADDFVRNVTDEIAVDDVFVFSPRGEVFNLPSGSTPIDFAYRVHSELGHRMSGARVNGRIVPIGTELKTGDIVEIITSSTVHGPSRDWLNIVRSNQARSKIRRWLKNENREENILVGKDNVEKEMKRQKLGQLAERLMEPERIQRFVTRHNYNSIEDAYNDVGYGGISAATIVAWLLRIYEEDSRIEIGVPKEHMQQRGGRTDIRQKPKPVKGVLIEGADNCLIRFMQCCTPVPGDDIIGYVTRTRGVSVHRVVCVNAASGVDDTNRLVKATWVEEADKETYVAAVTVVGNYRPSLDTDIKTAFSAADATLKGQNSAPPINSKDRNSFIKVYTLRVSDKEMLEEAMRRVNAVDGVVSVTRLGV